LIAQQVQQASQTSKDAIRDEEQLVELSTQVIEYASVLNMRSVSSDSIGCDSLVLCGLQIEVAARRAG